MVAVEVRGHNAGNFKKKATVTAAATKAATTAGEASDLDTAIEAETEQQQKYYSLISRKFSSSRSSRSCKSMHVM